VATTDNNVAATASPSGQITAIAGMGAQAVSVTFTSDDSRPTSNLRLRNVPVEPPPGWSSDSNNFNCAAVGGGALRRLALTFAPAVPDSGTLTLGSGYINNAGIAKTGTVAIAYSAAKAPP